MHTAPRRPSPSAACLPARFAARVAAVGLGLGMFACADAPANPDSTEQDLGYIGYGGSSGYGGSIATGGQTQPAGDATVSTGGQAQPGGASGSGGIEPTGGASGTGGGSGGTLLGPDAGTGGSPVPRPAQLVAAIVLTETPQVPTSSAQVAVTEPGTLPNQPGCSVVHVDPNGAQPTAVSYDAGPIVVSGVQGAPLTFQPSPSGGGYTYQLNGGVPEDLFCDGATLSAHGSGGSQFGAFDVQVVAPQGLSISAPNQGFGEQAPAGDPLDIRWNAGQSESLLITIAPAEGLDFTPQAGNWVFCGVPDTGSFTVPAGTLVPLAQDAGILGQQALVILTRTRVSLGQAGADQVFITASTTQGVPLALSP